MIPQVVFQPISQLNCCLTTCLIHKCAGNGFRALRYNNNTINNDEQQETIIQTIANLKIDFCASTEGNGNANSENSLMNRWVSGQEEQDNDGLAVAMYVTLLTWEIN